MYLYFIISFILSVLFNIYFIPFFRKIKCGQSIRELGPKAHLTKSGTPTMGGVFIVLSISIVMIIYGYYKHIISDIFILIFPILYYSLVGFIDDFLKVKTRNNSGISPLVKLSLQIIGALLYVILFRKELDTNVDIFGCIFDLGNLYYLFIIFIFAAVTNAYNLCDGLDGLASGVGLIIITSLIYLLKAEIINVYIISSIGAILGFLVYNFHPAKIFMGDTGSLAIGALIANLFIILKIEFYLIIFAFPLIIEVLSVIIQVIYFKLTKGKRVFLMTPFHHHLELLGYKEIEVDILFWGLTVLFSFLGLYFSTYFS